MERGGVRFSVVIRG